MDLRVLKYIMKETPKHVSEGSHTAEAEPVPLLNRIARAHTEGLKVHRDEKMRELGKELHNGFKLTGWVELAEKSAKLRAMHGRTDNFSSTRGSGFYDFRTVVQSMLDHLDNGIDGDPREYSQGVDMLETSANGYLIADAVAELGIEEVYKTFGEELIPMIDAALDATTEELVSVRDTMKEQLAIESELARYNYRRLQKSQNEFVETIKILEKAKEEVANIHVKVKEEEEVRAQRRANDLAKVSEVNKKLRTE